MNMTKMTETFGLTIHGYARTRIRTGHFAIRTAKGVDIVLTMFTTEFGGLRLRELCNYLG